MRIAAIILNVLLLLVVAIVVPYEGVPSPSEHLVEFMMVLIVLVTPIFTLLTFLLGSPQSWLSLYFKRRAAEERKRIAQLESEINAQQAVLSGSK